MRPSHARLLAFPLAAALWMGAGARADVVSNLVLLRDRCLYYAVGRAPHDVNTKTLRHGLYAQSPFAVPSGEVDLAASGFALAALPAAVANGLISSNAAAALSTNAAARVRSMVQNSLAATNAAQIALYGYGGMLHHYCVWSDGAQEFQGKSGVEVSSIDTTLMLYGLLVCSQYFGGATAVDYSWARDHIRWRDWIETQTVGHLNQVRMAYTPGVGFAANWWDQRSDETTLVSIMAAMGDTNLDARVLWRAWTRTPAVYESPASNRFSCIASWFGDPFTDFYALTFLDTARFPPDGDGVDWFENNGTSYRGHVAFFREERAFLDSMTYAFTLNGVNPVARPCGSPDVSAPRTEAALYSIAGGLPFYSPSADANPLAVTLADLVGNPANLFDWHGWPVDTLDATQAGHPRISNAIVGQNILSIALSIDNYLTHRTQNLALRDARLQRILGRIFPARAVGVASDGAGSSVSTHWAGIPFASLVLETTAEVSASSWSSNQWAQIPESGQWAATHVTTESPHFVRARGVW